MYTWFKVIFKYFIEIYFAKEETDRCSLLCVLDFDKGLVCWSSILLAFQFSCLTSYLFNLRLFCKMVVIVLQ